MAKLKVGAARELLAGTQPASSRGKYQSGQEDVVRGWVHCADLPFTDEPPSMSGSRPKELKVIAF
ncbi:MAG TPA: hypothetical protein VJX67_14685 [Blastocatellia bacterium]|nr:hypothetical protein [Blastocatellia bacterium]